VLFLQGGASTQFFMVPMNLMRPGDTAESGKRGVRVRVQFGGSPEAASTLGISGVSAAENALEFVVAEAIVRLQGGHFRLEAGEAGETIAILDLPG
jgi:hypothetical protein